MFKRVCKAGAVILSSAQFNFRKSYDAKIGPGDVAPYTIVEEVK